MATFDSLSISLTAPLVANSFTIFQYPFVTWRNLKIDNDVSEWLLFNAKFEIFQLYIVREQVAYPWEDDGVGFALNQHTEATADE